VANSHHQAQHNWEKIGSEVLYVIYAKMARRLRKLEDLGQLKLLHSQWTIELRTSMVDAHAFINKHWTALSRTLDASANTASLLKLQPANDLEIALPELDNFLKGVAARQRDTAAIDFKPDACYPTYPPSEIPTTLNASGDHKFPRILALEA
jgi:hypothetical protein